MTATMNNNDRMYRQYCHFREIVEIKKTEEILYFRHIYNDPIARRVPLSVRETVCFPPVSLNVKWSDEARVAYDKFCQVLKKACLYKDEEQRPFGDLQVAISMIFRAATEYGINDVDVPQVVVWLSMVDVQIALSYILSKPQITELWRELSYIDASNLCKYNLFSPNTLDSLKDCTGVHLGVWPSQPPSDFKEVEMYQKLFIERKRNMTKDINK